MLEPLYLGVYLGAVRVRYSSFLLWLPNTKMRIMAIQNNQNNFVDEICSCKKFSSKTYQKH